MIELLVVLSLLGVVAVAIFSAFSSGVNIWKRLNEQTQGEDAAILFQKLARDLRNSVEFRGMDFQGDPELLSFAVVRREAAVSSADRVCLVTYQLDLAEGAVTREVRGMSEIYEGHSGSILPVVGNVRSLSFAYFYQDPQTKNYLWSETWPPKVTSDGVRRPTAVSAEMVLRKDGGDARYTKHIPLPGCV